ncbi:hypothetical protein DRE_06082 [Drechslerella stenobrocha 248]|uniref:LIM zinc-binding domain-containing protein n=1 Tax=Drechslerella stenobrocha 248 TaxID=1043628 RepID=W7HPX3_9PEZI|nr:hypothetical protein DRE_06082 [Drechslerella stenobrocha 248]
MERVRPSFMTKEQLNRYMSDVKQNRAPRPRPNFELPAKRLSLTLTEQLAPTADAEQPKPAPIARVASDASSAFRRFGGSVRDTQRAHGTVRRNGWIVGDGSAKQPLFGRKPTVGSSTPAASRETDRPKSVEEKPAAVSGRRDIGVEDKENKTAVASTPILEPSLEESMTQLQKDISEEIDAVSILLDSPTTENGFSPTVEDIEEELEHQIHDSKPESPAPLKISRTPPVDIKSTAKVLHSSQMPEGPISITNINTVHYQVNDPPTPSSTPPEPERRPKFEDRGVPTFTPAAPPTPPTKVMVVEDDKIVAEMALDDGKDNEGYNLQQGRNPNAIIPSAGVSRIASKISEMQLKADPYAAPPKPAFPIMTMDEFKERNESPSTPTGAPSPVTNFMDSQFTFPRTNSLPPTMPSHICDSTLRKAYEPPQYKAPQYKPYRPPTQAAAPSPVNQASPAFLRARTGSTSTIVPPTCPSPAPGHSPAQRAIPSHMNSAHSRHSSLGSLYQYGQQPVPHGTGPIPGHPQHRQSLPLQPLPSQFQIARASQSGPPPLPHAPHRSGPSFHRSSPSAPVNDFGMRNSPVSNTAQPATRALPVLPRDLSAAVPKPPSPTYGSNNEPQESLRQSSPVVEAPLTKSQIPVTIPTFAFDEVDRSRARQLPATPSRGALPSAPSKQASDKSKSETKALPPVPVFSFSDNSTPSPSSSSPTDDSSTRPNVPVLNLPDDDADYHDHNNDKQSNPSVPTFSLSGPEEPTNRRPLPTPAAQKQDSRPLPSPNVKLNGNSLADKRAMFETHAYHAKSLIPKSIAGCTACGNHISARAVSASGLKFHPECFRCSHCNTRLEHVAFYPEPLPGDSPANAEPTGRFFCHLDFHELFSPRCKSCKTPIEGEVVEACGATWHAGHFFCAECGDPFDAQSRFVEKDKFAWCLHCYQKRYSSKCKKCKKPVVDTVVKALDADWHMECFCCFECGSEFQDGRYFLRDGCKNEPVCTNCEETRLKSWELVQ